MIRKRIKLLPQGYMMSMLLMIQKAAVDRAEMTSAEIYHHARHCSVRRKAPRAPP